MAAFPGIAAAFLILVASTGHSWADQKDPRLDKLFVELQEPNNPQKARLIERSIWNIWVASDSPTLELLMNRVIMRMGNQEFGEALHLLDAIVTISPDYAEGWNKRATVYYLLGRYEDSISDVQKTLDLEPRHFGALSGLGLIYNRLDEDAAALDAFERALKVNPHLSQAKQEVKRLRGRIKGRRI